MVLEDKLRGSKFPIQINLKKEDMTSPENFREIIENCLTETGRQGLSIEFIVSKPENFYIVRITDWHEDDGYANNFIDLTNTNIFITEYYDDYERFLKQGNFKEQLIASLEHYNFDNRFLPEIAYLKELNNRVKVKNITILTEEQLEVLVHVIKDNNKFKKFHDYLNIEITYPTLFTETIINKDFKANGFTYYKQDLESGNLETIFAFYIEKDTGKILELFTNNVILSLINDYACEIQEEIYD
jgi:hypothetical protein